mgnify:CR=1 FL=1
MILEYWGQKVNVRGDIWEVEIKNPIYGTVVSINEKLLRHALKARATLLVITKGASEVIDPQDWIDQSTKFLKIFRDSNNPMPMYKRAVGKPQPKQRQEDVIKDIQLSFLTDVQQTR